MLATTTKELAFPPLQICLIEKLNFVFPLENLNIEGFDENKIQLLINFKLEVCGDSIFFLVAFMGVRKGRD